MVEVVSSTLDVHKWSVCVLARTLLPSCSTFNFCATGITAYLQDGGKLEIAQ